LLSAHYRSMLEYSPSSLSESTTAYSRILNFVNRAKELVEPSGQDLPDEFVAAMNDDLNLPIALSVLHEKVRRGNSLISDENSSELSLILAEVIAMLEVLGLSALNQANTGQEQIIDSLVQAIIDEREAARVRKDFATADALRDKLLASGLIIEDTPTGVRWSIKR